MGNSLSTETIAERYSSRVNQYKHNKVVKTSAGTFQVVVDQTSNLPFILFPIYYDSDESFENLKRALDDILAAQKEGHNVYVIVHAAEVTDKRLLCLTSSFIIVLDYFQMSLDDAIGAGL